MDVNQAQRIQREQGRESASFHSARGKQIDLPQNHLRLKSERCMGDIEARIQGLRKGNLYQTTTLMERLDNIAMKENESVKEFL